MPVAVAHAVGSYNRRMNHLAHAWLAGDDAALITGGLLGDFWRGAPDPAWPRALGAGVVLHRRIDVFTDAHAAVAAARALFDPPYRRYAGILLDVWFDHLLARDFERWTGTPLRPFVERVYATLGALDATLPAPFLMFAHRTAANDGLAAYADREHLWFVFEHIAARLSRANPVATAVPALEALERPIERAFATLWPDLVAFVTRERKRLCDP